MVGISVYGKLRNKRFEQIVINLESVEFILPFKFPAYGKLKLSKRFSARGLVKYYVLAL